MTKKDIRSLTNEFGKNAVALAVGVSPRTMQGYLNGRKPGRSARIILQQLIIKSNSF